MLKRAIIGTDIPSKAVRVRQEKIVKRNAAYLLFRRTDKKIVIKDYFSTEAKSEFNITSKDIKVYNKRHVVPTDKNFVKLNMRQVSSGLSQQGSSGAVTSLDLKGGYFSPKVS